MVHGLPFCSGVSALFLPYRLNDFKATRNTGLVHEQNTVNIQVACPDMNTGR